MSAKTARKTRRTKPLMAVAVHCLVRLWRRVCGLAIEKPEYLITVKYNRGKPVQWITDLPIKQAFLHIPKLGEKHGNQYVESVESRQIL